MAIPDFQSLMLPILQLMGDEREHANIEIIQELATAYQLAEVEREKLLPSGRQRVFDNRVTWGITYLYKGNLIEKTARGWHRITERGLYILHNEKPQRIDLKYLSQFPEIQAFRSKRNEDTTSNDENDVFQITEMPETPEEILENGYGQIRKKLAQELIDRVKQSSPTFFERLVVDLLVRMGYGGTLKDAGKSVGRSGDGGIDGLINEDRLGLDVVYIQAKRWENTVGRPDIQRFAGSLDGERARKGIFITTSDFSREALEYVKRIDKKIVLINGEELAEYMIEFSVGTAESAHYIIKRIDSDYFVEE